eukprot:sb/3468822/
MFVATPYIFYISSFFRISRSTWKSVHPDIMPIVGEIESHLTDLSPFLEALTTLTPPAMHFKDLVDEADVTGSQDILDRISQEIFQDNTESKTRAKFASSNGKSWNSLRAKLSKGSVKGEQVLKELRRFQGELKQSASAPTQLKDYSTWFHDKYVMDSLEMPGKPELKIHKFLGKVSVLPSLRKPVKITVILNNGQVCSLLVKGGEDLRTDNRVMQILRVMNETLVRSEVLEQSTLVTYNVVPITTNC